MLDNRIPIIYLAAGKSKRMGVNKLALPLGKSTIGSAVLEELVKADIGHVFVVTKVLDDLQWINPCLFQHPIKRKWTAVPCRDADLGQAHSLQCGLRAAVDINPSGVMILLADQPFLSIATIRHLSELFLKHTCREISFVAASFQGVPRPPIIFSPHAFPLLLELNGDTGARKLLQHLKGESIEYDNEIEFLDIDTVEEYQQVKGMVT